MTILKTNLEILYQKNPNLEQLYPFKETFERLDFFINSEVRDGKFFLKSPTAKLWVKKNRNFFPSF